MDGKTEDGTETYLFSRREFSFAKVLPNGNEVYMRYLSYANKDRFHDDLIKKCPTKIDIGAIYNEQPSNHQAIGKKLRPQQRELVFDIDLTDYDDIRTCCVGASVCQNCWKFISIAIKVLDKALEEDFGFEHRLWIYSGRRGVHCWIADRRARLLTNEARSAIVDYLSVVQGLNENKTSLDLPTPLHPSLQRAYDILLDEFENWSIAETGQALLCNRESWQKVLRFVPYQDLVDEIDQEWSNNPDMTGIERWEDLQTRIANKLKEKRMKPSTNRTDCLKEIVFAFTYPRLDMNVSKGMNHLLKSPFCVHPKTGRICVPITVEDCEIFEPDRVPTLQGIIQDARSGESKPDTCLFEQTSLAPFIGPFENFVLGLEEAARQEFFRRKRGMIKKKLYI